MKNRWSSFSCTALACAVLAGCFSLEKSYPEKRYFALSASRPGPPLAAPLDHVLTVRPLRISPAYAGSEFVYETGDVTRESDFYNEFFIPPSRQITEEVRRWLDASGLFKTVVDSASSVESTRVLEGAVQAIYGEYLPSASPRAVLELQLFLLESGDEGMSVLLQKSFSRRIEAADDSAAALVRGWNQALAEILTELEGTLRGEVGRGGRS